MPEAPVTVLGGLSLIAEVWYTRGDGWSTDDDAGVDHLYWRKRDGSRGKEVPEKVYERLAKQDSYWEAGVVEQVSDYLAYKEYEARESLREPRMAGIHSIPPIPS